MNSWATDLAVEKRNGGGREVLRILTRPWSEDSSTPIGKNNRKTDREKQRERQTNQATERKGQQHNTQPNQTNEKKGGGEGGASVEKPDTSLARQFKHPELKLERSNQIPRTLRLRSNG